MENSRSAFSIYKPIVHDMAIFIAIYFLPAISHWSPFSLSILEPMRVFLFVGYVLSYSRFNALFLAVTIPFFSFLVTGHPMFYKAILIATELVVHFSIFLILINRYRTHSLLYFIVGLVASKIIYYLLKFLFLKIGLLEGLLFTGSFTGQAIAAVFLSIVFAFSFNSSKHFGIK